MRSTLARTQEAMATEFAALAWRRGRSGAMRTFQDAERGLCFGRLTLDGTPRPLYVGRRWVHDDERESLVVNWQAPAARPFYTATPRHRTASTQRRRFRTDGRRITDISDESLDGSAVEGASVSDFLLEELERRRDGRHARHRRHDPVGPVPADHGRAGRRARRAGRAGHRQDRRRAAPRVLAPLHAPRAAAPRARRRPEPDVHGLRLARAAGARRGGGRAARGHRAPRRDRGRRGRRRRTWRG